MSLLLNLDKLHTTKLGEDRIRKNVGVKADDVVEWCKERIHSADKIIRQGKNWYVRAGGVILTINAYSFTIITAHMQNKFHPANEGEHKQ